MIGYNIIRRKMKTIEHVHSFSNGGIESSSNRNCDGLFSDNRRLPIDSRTDRHGRWLNGVDHITLREFPINATMPLQITGRIYALRQWS